MSEQFKYLFFVFCLSLAFFSKGQDASNPFELIPRLEHPFPVTENLEESTDSAVVNPFDLIFERPRPEVIGTYEVDPAIDPLITSDLDRFKFFSIGALILLLAIAVSLVGSTFSKAIQSFFNDNAYNQYYRERERIGAAPYYILYLLFFINLGFFLFLLLNHFKIRLPVNNPIIAWALLTGLSMGSLLLKHIVLLLFGTIFPVMPTVRKYIFYIIVSAITGAAALIILNLLMAYGPEGSGDYVLTAALILGAILYLFHVLRSLLLANKYLVFHRFHFLLYICTVEIAPVFILIRLILLQM